jgi:hypothetical protein
MLFIPDVVLYYNEIMHQEYKFSFIVVPEEICRARRAMKRLVDFKWEIVKDEDIGGGGLFGGNNNRGTAMSP